MTGIIYGSGGGQFAFDGNVFVNTGGYSDWLSNLLSYRYSTTGGQFSTQRSLLISGHALSNDLSQFCAEYNGSCFRIRNDGGATYFMNGNANGWTNYTHMDTAGNWNFPNAVTVQGKFTGNGTVSIIGDFYSINAYNNTVSSSANMHIGNSHKIGRSSSSSKRYKHDVTSELSNSLDPKNLYKLDVVQYKYNEDYLSENDTRYLKDVIGFIAEDVYKKYPIAANYSVDTDKGQVIVEDWDARYMIPAMLKLIQEQHERIVALEENTTS